MRQLLIALGLLLSWSTLALADFTVSTDVNDWSANFVDIREEGFDDEIFIDGLTVVSDVGAVSAMDSQWQDRIDEQDETEWFFDSPVDGFGGFWDLLPGGSGTGIQLTVTLENGDTVVLADEIPSSLAGGFWGFTSDERFTSVRLSMGTGTGVAETYSQSSLLLGSVVPEPGTFSVVASLALLVGVRRRR